MYTDTKLDVGNVAGDSKINLWYIYSLLATTINGRPAAVGVV